MRSFFLPNRAWCDTIWNMDHSDHLRLLRPAKLPRGGVWADLGAGSGAFTLALRELVGPGGLIYAVDRNRGRLAELEGAYFSLFDNTGNLRTLNADFSQGLALPPLDGLLMANSLHFFKDKEPVLRQVSSFLKPGGTLLLVEYNVDRGNPWVPYPLSFGTFQSLALDAGFHEPALLAKHPSSFLREFYSAMTFMKQ